MKTIIALLTWAVGGGTFSTAASAERANVSWQDLAPTSVEIVDPFESLRSDQMEALRRILRLEGEDEPEKRAYAQGRIRELQQSDDPRQQAEADELRKLARFELMDPEEKKAEADKIRAELTV